MSLSAELPAHIVFPAVVQVLILRSTDEEPIDPANAKSPYSALANSQFDPIQAA